MEISTNLIIAAIIISIVILTERKARDPDKPETISYGRYSITERGEIVRSKAEKTIADYFFHNGIEYNYEKKINGMLTDFFLPRYKVAVEYYGMINVLGEVGDKYREKTAKKNYKYQKNGVNLIQLYPKDLNKLYEIFSKFT